MLLGSFDHPEQSGFNSRACSYVQAFHTDRKIALRAKYGTPDAPTRPETTRPSRPSSRCFAEAKPLARIESDDTRSILVSGRPRYVFQHAHPSAHACCRETCPPAEIVPRNGCPAAARSTLHKTLIRTVVVGPHIYTVHTGDRTPAVYLAETEEHWHMPWPFG